MCLFFLTNLRAMMKMMILRMILLRILLIIFAVLLMMMTMMDTSSLSWNKIKYSGQFLPKVYVQMYAHFFCFQNWLWKCQTFPKNYQSVQFLEMVEMLCVLVSKLKYSVHRPLSRKYRSRWDTEKKPQTYLENNKFYRTNYWPNKCICRIWKKPQTYLKDKKFYRANYWPSK